MSYILEALRKSERQRRANDEPPLARLAAEAPRSTRRRSIVITLSVLANIGLLIYLLLPLSSRTGSGGSVGPKTIATESPPGIPQSGQAPVPEATKSPEAGVTPVSPEAVPKTPARPRPSAPAKPATMMLIANWEPSTAWANTSTATLRLARRSVAAAAASTMGVLMTITVWDGGRG